MRCSWFHWLYLLILCVMQQLRLFSQTQPVIRTHDFEYIKATFTAISDSVHEVVLEINSNKFLISLKAGLQKLEQFEVIAVKGFVELGMKIIRLLKRIVSALYFEH